MYREYKEEIPKTKIRDHLSMIIAFFVLIWKELLESTHISKVTKSQTFAAFKAILQN